MSEMEFGELCSEFFRMERDRELLNKTITDVHFWERVRVLVHKRIATAYGVLEDSGEAADGGSEYLAGAGLFLRNMVSGNPFFSDSGDLMFYGKGRRKQLTDGLWWDIYIDPVVTDIDRSCVCLERPYEVSHRGPTKTEDLRYTDLILYSGTILEKLGLSTVSLSESDKQMLDRVEREIQSRFGVDVPLATLVTTDLARRRVRLPLYRRIIRRVDPDVAFLTSAYNGRETFVEACQSLDVPVVELQHGVISKYHMGYSFPYENKNVFPDYFFSFGEYWVNAVDLPIPNERVIHVGFPYLERRSAEYDHVESKNQVVFISQPPVGGPLSQFALKLARTPEFDADIIYKLHPKEFDAWEQEYPDLVESPVRVVTDDPPLYQLLAESCSQVGVYSTALYEGLRFGLETYVLDAPGAENIEHLYANQYATLVNSVEEFIDSSGSTAETDTIVDYRHFFEPNASDRFEEAVATIISARQEDNALSHNRPRTNYGSPDGRDR